MVELAKKRNGNCLSSEYVNSKTKLLWQCENSHTWAAAPEKISIKLELTEQFKKEYRILLNSAADHSLISKRILPALTDLDHILAEEYVDFVNTIDRRDAAYSLVIRRYIKRESNEISLDFLEKLLEKIEHIHYRDWVFVQVLNYFSRNDVGLSKADKYRLKDRVYSIKSAIGKSYALSYYFVWMNEDDKKLCDILIDHLKISMEQITSLEDRLSTGFQCSSIISKVDKEQGFYFYNRTKERKSQLAFSDFRISELFVSSCKLLITMMPEVLKAGDYEEKLDIIIKLINSIPSVHEQVSLLSHLALKCHLSDKDTWFIKISEVCIDLLEKINDDETYDKCFMYIAPMIYQYERSILFEKINSLPAKVKETALNQVVKYILTKRLPEDNVDWNFSGHKIDFKDAMQVCDVLEHISDDQHLYSVINGMVNSITEPSAGNKLRSKLHEKHLITIAERLVLIIKAKLPYSRNFTHKGYYILAMAAVLKLKYACSHNRAQPKWKTLVEEWDVLRDETNKINNISDRAYVFARAASSIGLFNSGAAASF